MHGARDPEPHHDALGPPHVVSAFDVVVVGASLGGRAAIERILGALPVVFPIPVVIVQHMRANVVSHLPELLAARSRLPVRHAFDGELLRPSCVYVAMPDQHLVIDGDRRCRRTDGPRHRFSRPAIDVLFCSAADMYGARTLGVVLSGMLDDGAAGAAAIRQHGGEVLVQEPASCTAPSMPRAAMERGGARIALPPDALGAAITALVTTPGMREVLGLGARIAA